MNASHHHIQSNRPPPPHLSLQLGVFFKGVGVSKTPHQNELAEMMSQHQALFKKTQNEITSKVMEMRIFRGCKGVTILTSHSSDLLTQYVSQTNVELAAFFLLSSSLSLSPLCACITLIFPTLVSTHSKMGGDCSFITHAYTRASVEITGQTESRGSSTTSLVKSVCSGLIWISRFFFFFWHPLPKPRPTSKGGTKNVLFSMSIDLIDRKWTFKGNVSALSCRPHASTLRRVLSARSLLRVIKCQTSPRAQQIPIHCLSADKGNKVGGTIIVCRSSRCKARSYKQPWNHLATSVGGEFLRNLRTSCRDALGDDGVKCFSLGGTFFKYTSLSRVFVIIIVKSQKLQSNAAFSKKNKKKWLLGNRPRWLNNTTRLPPRSRPERQNQNTTPPPLKKREVMQITSFQSSSLCA